MFRGYPILLVGFKVRDELLDLSGVDIKYPWYRVDWDFILDDTHEWWAEHMRRCVRRKYVGLTLQSLCCEFWGLQRKDLGLTQQCLYLICCGGGRQAALTVETSLEATAARGWVDEVCYQRDLSGGCDKPFCWWDLCFPLLSCLPLCMQWRN